MYSGAKKLHLIEELLKVKSESIWITLENLLTNTSTNDTSTINIYDFVGIISPKEAELMKGSILAVNTID